MGKTYRNYPSYPRVAIPKPTKPHRVKGRDDARVNKKVKIRQELYEDDGLLVGGKFNVEDT
jgi:hypothetical protein